MDNRMSIMHMIGPRGILGRGRCTTIVLTMAATCLLFVGCHKTTPPTADAASAPSPKTSVSAQTKEEAAGKEAGDAKEGAPAKEGAAAGVTLTPEQIEKLGVTTESVQATEHRDEVVGYGVVMSHETIATAKAELVTAQATERLSRSALARAKKLSGTPGAVSADVEETAAQKAEVDAAALTLTNQRLSSSLGMNPPWKNGDSDAMLQQLASGKIKLVRVTFPLGTLSGEKPSSLRAAHIGNPKAGTGWKLNVIWDAPADASVPGRSFFAVLKGSDVGEGERLQVWAPVGDASIGISVPAAAVVLSDGKYWCFVEKKAGTFTKTEIDTDKPTADGYFVSDGVVAGDKVVVTAAGQLLAAGSASAESD